MYLPAFISKLLSGLYDSMFFLQIFCGVILGICFWNGRSDIPQIGNILIPLITFHTGGVFSMSMMVLQMITTVL